MNKNTNPWMLATIFLFGLIIGFLLGKIPFGTPQQMIASNPQNNIQNNQNPVQNNGNPGAGTVGATQQQPALQTAPANDYSTVQKSTDAQGNFSIGNKNAKVTVAEYSDFQCPFCYRYFSSAFPQILTNYIATGKINYTFHTYPLNIHPQAPKAAESALCAGDQGKFWEYHDLLFANQNLWSGNDGDIQIFENLAQNLNLDANAFSNCLTSGKYTAAVNREVAAGDKKEVSGTPTIFVNDQKIVGAQDFSAFQQAISQELAK
jgi:protein-disulfide isomerase